MIIVSGTIAVDPEDADALLAITAPCVLATRQEPGNTAYGFYGDPDTPGSFRVYEEWADEDALNAHMVSPHMAAMLGQMGTVRVTEVNLNRHDVTNVSKLM
jgi:quinol monooxygenase YgiN